MGFPILLFLRPKRRQRSILPLRPRNLNNHKPDEIRQRPIATMRAEHIQILDVQRTSTAREEIVNLAVVVKEVHATFGDLLAGEIMCLEFDVGGELVNGCGSGLGCGGACAC